MTKCVYYDCGWCYSPDIKETNAVQGGCFEPDFCPFLIKQRMRKEIQISKEEIAPTIIEIGGVKYQRVDEELESKPETLYDIIYEWYVNHDENDEISFKIDDLVFLIEEWLPKEQIANSQNTYVECTVEGFNDCLREIKSRLR